MFASLNVSQFTDEADGGTWRLADGSSAAGTDWAAKTGRTNLPDIRGRFVRGKDNGASNAPTDPALDTVVADSIKSHDHVMTHTHTDSFRIEGTTTFPGIEHEHEFSHEHKWGSKSSNVLNSYDSLGLPQSVTSNHTDDGNAGTSLKYATIPDGAANFYTGDTVITGDGSSGAGGEFTADSDSDDWRSFTFEGEVGNHIGNTGSTGVAETAPRHVVENAFIKVDRGYIRTTSRLFVIRMPQDLTVNQILVSPVVQGTAGDFKIDIKKGASPASATTSIFQSGQQPSLAYDASSGATGLVDSSKNRVLAGQFLVVSIETTQTKLQEVHLSISGDF